MTQVKRNTSLSCSTLIVMVSMKVMPATHATAKAPVIV